jgi:hypothetical protein
MAGPKDLTASSAEEEASAQAAPEASAKAHGRRDTGGVPPPDPAKQSDDPLRDNAGWPTGRGPDNRFRAEQKEREGGRDAASGTDPESPATQRPVQDRTGVVAPPAEGEQPGSSGKLGGTPSAPAAGRGRQID